MRTKEEIRKALRTIAEVAPRPFSEDIKNAMVSLLLELQKLEEHENIQTML